MLECVCNCERETSTFKNFKLIFYRLGKCFGAAGFITDPGAVISVGFDFTLETNQVGLHISLVVQVLSL